MMRRAFVLGVVVGLAVAGCGTAPPAPSGPGGQPGTAATAPSIPAGGPAAPAPPVQGSSPPAPAQAAPPPGAAQGAGTPGPSPHAGTAASAPNAPPPSPARRYPDIKPGDYRYAIGSGAAMRSYGLHVPRSYDRTRALPLVIVLHGRGGSAVTARAFGFNESADHNGFFVVYPEAVAPARMWFTGLEAGPAGADDVAYVGDVLSDVSELVAIDARRIYAAGYSNGGTLAAHLAGALPASIAGLAVVDANIAIRNSQGALTTVAVPKQPVSALFIHGRMDHASPYGGGTSPVLGGNDALGAREGVSWWAQAMSCAAEPQALTTGELEVLRYTGCRNGVAVQLVSYPGAHDWPQTLPLDAKDPPRLADYITNFFFGKGDPLAP